MTAAIAAARTGAKVAVAERMVRVGKKLLASGNGRCNLSNVNIDENFYHGADVKSAFSILKKNGDNFAVDFFRSLGVLVRLEDQSRYYPATFSSNTVLDALRSEAARLGVAEMCSYEAVSVIKTSRVFTTCFKDKPDYISDRIIIAAGGMSSPHLGSNGSGYKLFTDMGHSLITPAPMLTQIHLDAGGIRGLKGIRVHAGLSLISKKCEKTIFKDKGELLFTDHGLSGIPAFNLSCRLAPQISAALQSGVYKTAPVMRCDGYTVSIDLFPEYTHKEMYEFLIFQVKNKPDIPVRDILCGIMNNRVAAHITTRFFDEIEKETQNSGKTAKKIPPGDLRLSDKNIAYLTSVLKDLRHRIIGTSGFENAQVTYGGLSIDDFYPDTLESKIVKGLYAAGEILDIAGDCGGYNLHWAWASGYTAGGAAAQR